MALTGQESASKTEVTRARNYTTSERPRGGPWNRAKVQSEPSVRGQIRLQNHKAKGEIQRE